MTDLRKAAEQALEALETLMLEKGSVYDHAIQALRQALAQPELVGLTEDEFEAILESHNEAFPFAVYKSIETKLKEKNT